MVFCKDRVLPLAVFKANYGGISENEIEVGIGLVDYGQRVVESWLT